MGKIRFDLSSGHDKRSVAPGGVAAQRCARVSTPDMAAVIVASSTRATTARILLCPVAGVAAGCVVSPAGRPMPDMSDEALTNLFEGRRADEDHRAFGGPQGDLHKILGIRPPEDEPLSGEYYLDYVNFVISGPPAQALDLVIAICERAPDDHALCWVGSVFVEPLLDLHWAEVSERFEHQAGKRRSLRVAYSCAMTHLPRKARPWQERMQRLMQRDDLDRPPRGG
jgi:hypothetical protein